MKKISFIIILALGLMACEKDESGPVVDRELANGKTEKVENQPEISPEEITGTTDPGIDAINDPVEPGKETKGKSEGNN
jgi:hypothetical protein